LNDCAHNYRKTEQFSNKNRNIKKSKVFNNQHLTKLGMKVVKINKL